MVTGERCTFSVACQELFETIEELQVEALRLVIEERRRAEDMA